MILSIAQCESILSHLSFTCSLHAFSNPVLYSSPISLVMLMEGLSYSAAERTHNSAAWSCMQQSALFLLLACFNTFCQSLGTPDSKNNLETFETNCLCKKVSLLQSYFSLCMNTLNICKDCCKGSILYFSNVQVGHGVCIYLVAVNLTKNLQHMLCFLEFIDGIF